MGRVSPNIDRTCNRRKETYFFPLTELDWKDLMRRMQFFTSLPSWTTWFAWVASIHWT